MFDDFYGLDARPFQLTPDPAFYFESSTHRKALSYLGYGLAQGEGFVVITGEVGAGKSTLVAYLMATIDPARMTAANVVTSALDGEEIVHVVAQSFGLPVMGHDKASALGTLEAFFHDEARAGRRCLLIVDEAQNLSVSALEELRMLSNFQLGSHPLLQTLLLGQPEPVDDRVYRRPHHRLGTVADRQAGQRHHLQVIGAVAHHDRVRRGHAQLAAHARDVPGLGVGIDQCAQQFPGQAPVRHFQMIRQVDVQAQLGGRARGQELAQQGAGRGGRVGPLQANAQP